MTYHTKRYRFTREGMIVARYPTKNGGWLYSIWDEKPDHLPIIAYSNKEYPLREWDEFKLSMNSDGKCFLNGMTAPESTDEYILSV